MNKPVRTPLGVHMREFDKLYYHLGGEPREHLDLVLSIERNVLVNLVASSALVYAKALGLGEHFTDLARGLESVIARNQFLDIERRDVHSQRSLMAVEYEAAYTQALRYIEQFKDYKDLFDTAITRQEESSCVHESLFRGNVPYTSSHVH